MTTTLLTILVAWFAFAGAATPVVVAQVAPGAGESVPAASVGAIEGAGVPHPVPPPADRRWPGVMVIVVLGLFLAAAVIGPIVRAELPAELPQTHTHDEPPGASRHHGRSGTLHNE